MTNLYFTICAFFVALLLLIDFFTKKRIKNNETNIFSKMIITSFFDTVLSYFILLIGYISPKSTSILVTLNKIDFLQYLLWAWFFFLYIFYITYKSNQKIAPKYPKVYKITLFINIIIYIAIIISPTYLHFDDGKWFAYGPSVNFLYIACCIYVILIVICLLLNIKNIKDRKYSPLFVLIGIAILMLILRQNSPQLLVIPAVLTYIDLIMYFTIENPDFKLLTEIKKAKDEVDQTNIDKSNFLFNITKNLKENMIEFEDYIDSSLASEQLHIIKENLNDMKYIVAKTKRTINNTLDISDEDVLKIKQIDNKYNIKNLLKEITIQTRARVKNNVDFRTEIESNLPEFLYGDSVKLKQILNSLLNNAIESTEEGFIELKISSITKLNVCRLIVNIEDSGVGFESKTIDKIFNQDNIEEDFTDENLSLKSITKIIHLIGGTFNITSKINLGTQVIFTMDQRIAKLDDSNISKYFKEIDQPKVLLISEDSDNTNKIKKAFERQNIIVDNVTQGEKGIKKIRAKGKFDLIIIDHDLSKLNGLTIHKKLKDIDNFSIPIVMMINNNNLILENYKELGIYKVLTKPIQLIDLKDMAKKIKESK